MTVAAEAGRAAARALARGGAPARARPLARPARHTFIADCETPVSAYLKLRGGAPSFLLESAEQGQRVGRWSFLGFRPRSVIRMDGGRLTVDGEERDRGRSIRARGGGAGSLAHGSARGPAALRRRRGRACSATTSCARRSRPSGTAAPDDTGMPDLALMVSDVLVAFDHLRHEVTVLANVVAGDDVERSYREAAQTIADVRERLAAPVPRAHAGAREPAEFESNLGAAGYAAAVERCEGVHPRRRRLPDRAEPALERRLPGGGVLHLPRAARGEPESVHVLPGLRGLRDRRAPRPSRS